MPEKDDLNIIPQAIITYAYKRGEVYSEELFEQKILFSGMNYHRNISPTDLDLFLEFNGNLFIYGECKKAPAKLTIGQEKALTHLVDSHTTAGNIAVALFFQHNISAPNPIYAKDLPVIAYYFPYYFHDKKWRPLKEKLTVHDLINKIIDYCRKKNISI